MTPPLRPVPEIPEHLRGTREAMASVLASQVGYREGANNDTAYGAWYPMNHAAWCAMFQSWGAERAGIPTSVIPKHAYTPSGQQWFRARGRLHSTPEPGDLGYVYYSSMGRVGHIFFVDSTYRSESGALIMRTIEGNTNDTGSSQGIGVFRLLRADTSNLSYGRPDYAAPSDPQEDDMAQADIDAMQAKLDKLLEFTGGVASGQRTPQDTQVATLGAVQNLTNEIRAGFASLAALLGDGVEVVTEEPLLIKLADRNAVYLMRTEGVREWITSQEDLAKKGLQGITPTVVTPEQLAAIPLVGADAPA